jgi:hypothetical protein
MSYSFEWVPGAVVLGVVGLFWVPPVALIVLFLAVIAAVAALLALVVAGPYFLIRALARRWRLHSVEPAARPEPLLVTPRRSYS